MSGLHPAITDAAAADDEAMASLASACIAATFGRLPPRDLVHTRRAVGDALDGGLDRLLDAAAPDTVLIWCTAAAEWCEREGLDAPIARLAPRAMAVDPRASLALRVFWRIAWAWHHEAFGRRSETARCLHEAQALSLQQAADPADPAAALGRAAQGQGRTPLLPIARLQLARLALAHSDPGAAMAHAREAVTNLTEQQAPLWHAHAADVASRVALVGGDFHDALYQARRCCGLATIADAPPAYSVTFKLNEAYAQAGLGAFDEATTIVAGLASVVQPPNLQRRLDTLGRLLGLMHDDAAGRPPDRAALADTMQRLRDLQWPGILPWLPRSLSRIWALALEQDVEAAWIRASIQTRRLDPPEPGWPRDWPWAVRVQTLGGFAWSCGPTPEAGASPGAAARGGAGPGAKSAQRPQELLRRLALSGGHDAVAMAPLAQVMWPGEGREGRAKALEVTLARLRKLLGCADAVLLQGQQLRLNPARVWLDRVALERLLQRLANPVTREAERAALWHEALALWRGPLLAGMTDEGDLAAARDALRRRMAAALLSDADGPARRSRCLRAVAADADLAPLLGPSAG